MTNSSSHTSQLNKDTYQATHATMPKKSETAKSAKPMSATTITTSTHTRESTDPPRHTNTSNRGRPNAYRGNGNNRGRGRGGRGGPGSYHSERPMNGSRKGPMPPSLSTESDPSSSKAVAPESPKANLMCTPRPATSKSMSSGDNGAKTQIQSTASSTSTSNSALASSARSSTGNSATKPAVSTTDVAVTSKNNPKGELTAGSVKFTPQTSAGNNLHTPKEDKSANQAEQVPSNIPTTTKPEEKSNNEIRVPKPSEAKTSKPAAHEDVDAKQTTTTAYSKVKSATTVDNSKSSSYKANNLVEEPHVTKSVKPFSPLKVEESKSSPYITDTRNVGEAKPTKQKVEEVNHKCWIIDATRIKEESIFSEARKFFGLEDSGTLVGTIDFSRWRNWASAAFDLAQAFKMSTYLIGTCADSNIGETRLLNHLPLVLRLWDTALHMQKLASDTKDPAFVEAKVMLKAHTPEVSTTLENDDALSHCHSEMGMAFWNWAKDRIIGPGIFSLLRTQKRSHLLMKLPSGDKVQGKDPFSLKLVSALIDTIESVRLELEDGIGRDKRPVVVSLRSEGGPQLPKEIQSSMQEQCSYKLHKL